MRIRLFISAVFVVVYGVFRSVYASQARYLLEAQLAPLQVSNNLQYGLSRMMTISDFVNLLFILLMVTVLGFMWLVYYMNQSEPNLEPGKMDQVLRWILVFSGFTISG